LSGKTTFHGLHRATAERYSMPTLETNEQGILCLPPELIGGAHPHAKFELEGMGDALVLRPINKERPLLRQTTSQQRAEAFQRWAKTPRPQTPDMPDELLRRENLYD
jgi:hypothetical protein